MKKRVILFALIILVILVIASVAYITRNVNKNEMLKKECCNECIFATSLIPSHDKEDSCSIFSEGYYSTLSNPLSDKCKEFFKKYPQITISECYEEDQLIGGCAGVSLDNLQECCNNWAKENNIVRIQCVGEWAIKNNQCAWECAAG